MITQPFWMKTSRPSALMITVAVLLAAGCTTYRPADRIDGLAAVRAIDGGVQVEPTSTLHVWQPRGSNSQITLRSGDEVLIGDGRHVSIAIQFVDQLQDRFRFCVRTLHRPPGGPTERKVKHVVVPAYPPVSH